MLDGEGRGVCFTLECDGCGIDTGVVGGHGRVDRLLMAAARSHAGKGRGCGVIFLTPAPYGLAIGVGADLAVYIGRTAQEQERGVHMNSL